MLQIVKTAAELHPDRLKGNLDVLGFSGNLKERKLCFYIHSKSKIFNLHTTGQLHFAIDLIDNFIFNILFPIYSSVLYILINTPYFSNIKAEQTHIAIGHKTIKMHIMDIAFIDNYIFTGLLRSIVPCQNKVFWKINPEAYLLITRLQELRVGNTHRYKRTFRILLRAKPDASYCLYPIRQLITGDAINNLSVRTNHQRLLELINIGASRFISQLLQNFPKPGNVNTLGQVRLQFGKTVIQIPYVDR